MKLMRTDFSRHTLALLLIAAHVGLASGCATLAHRSSVSGQRMRSTASCSGEGDTCPWLMGDAGLLLLGVVPGVIAFIVDFGTGAWRHENLPQKVMTTSDEVASSTLLFTPDRTASADARASRGSASSAQKK